MTDIEKRFKLVLLGDKRSGKSAFIRRFVNSKFTDIYVATLGVDVHPVPCQTNYGNYVLDVWDTAGDPKHGGLTDGYYIGANACIVFHDDQSDETLISRRLFRFKRMCPTATIIEVWNKVDLPNELARYQQYLNNHNIRQGSNSASNDFGYFIDISAKTSHNIHTPFNTLLRKLTNHPNLSILGYN